LNYPFPRTLLRKSPLWFVLLACFTIAATDLVGAATTPGYDMLRDTVSHLMRPDARYASILRGGLIAYGILLIPFAFQIRNRFDVTGWWKFFFVMGIWLHIGFVVAAALFQNDSYITILGIVAVNTIHDVGTVAMFIVALITLLSAALSAGDAPPRSGHFVYSRVSVLFFVCMVSIVMLAITTDLNGVTERANFAVFMVWITMTALLRYRQSLLAPVSANDTQASPGQYF
jgi:hypothetical protein